jgi:hypothetical protein
MSLPAVQPSAGKAATGSQACLFEIRGPSPEGRRHIAALVRSQEASQKVDFVICKPRSRGKQAG